MDQNILEIFATGERSAESDNSEVIVLGILDASVRMDLNDVYKRNPSWTLKYEVFTGSGSSPFGSALQAIEGRISVPISRSPKIAFLTHPWSGLVRVNYRQEKIEKDLYSSSTRVVVLDVETGEFAPISDAEFEQIRFSLNASTASRQDEKLASESNGILHSEDLRWTQSGRAVKLKSGIDSSSQSGQVEVRDHPLNGSSSQSGSAERSGAIASPPPNVLVIEATGERSTQAQESEVIILEFNPSDDEPSVDMVDLAKPFPAWEVVSEAYAQDMQWSKCLRSRHGKIHLACDPTGNITLLKHPWSGKARVSYGNVTMTLDLYAEQPSYVTLHMGNFELASKPQFIVDPGATQSKKYSALREKYLSLTADFDIDKPVALFVPRWRGVAASTKSLFPQNLPVPFGLTTHPDDLSELDVNQIAESLIETGCSHFVISGGDLFNIELIKHMRKRAPQIRFDQIWHSNFLQMGEPHDWNLLRHWIELLVDGVVTKIGVVKEGLADWFGTFGIQSVFIPNIVPFDYKKVVATSVSDRAGIWLSGSSAYRKLPHSSLLALKMLPDVDLRASGLDPQSISIVKSLGLRYSMLNPDPLPHEQLMSEIRNTGVSIYNTISECSPMLPLESFSLGVPCLVGPSSHLFQRDPYLFENLVIRQPHNPVEIAQKIEFALSHQVELLKRYITYHKQEERLACSGVKELTT